MKRRLDDVPISLAAGLFPADGKEQPCPHYQTGRRVKRFCPNATIFCFIRHGPAPSFWKATTAPVHLRARQVEDGNRSPCRAEVDLAVS